MNSFRLGIDFILCSSRHRDPYVAISLEQTYNIIFVEACRFGRKNQFSNFSDDLIITMETFPHSCDILVRSKMFCAHSTHTLLLVKRCQQSGNPPCSYVIAIFCELIHTYVFYPSQKKK